MIVAVARLVCFHLPPTPLPPPFACQSIGLPACLSVYFLDIITGCAVRLLHLIFAFIFVNIIFIAIVAVFYRYYYCWPHCYCSQYLIEVISSSSYPLYLDLPDPSQKNPIRHFVPITFFLLVFFLSCLSEGHYFISLKSHHH